MNQKLKDNEFKKGEIALYNSGVSKCEVKVQYWTKEYGGWWYVQLPNGGMHYTRLLEKIKN